MNKTKHFKSWKFIDLFAGLGGFHEALSSLGMECVFASEINQQLQNLYECNHGIRPHGDIRNIKESKIPKHNVLCAGFPCQPFSLAGRKKGNKCPSSGKLIDDVIRIAKYHKPDYVFLENVPNILTIDEGKFWSYIKNSFKKIGYTIDYKIYSPVEFGIPQKRKRVFVIASFNQSDIIWPTTDLESGKFPESLFRYIQNIVSDTNERKLENKKIKALKIWQRIIKNIPILSHHSIVASEFGATYPVEGMHKITLKELRTYKGAWGESLKDCKTWAQAFKLLPHYVDPIKKSPADWLIDSIKHSRKNFSSNPKLFKSFKKELSSMPRSWQKMQWQGDRNRRSIKNHVIQFRASGIRIIRPEFAPSLVAMTTTQTPIIGQTGMYMNAREAASLQGLEKLKALPDNRTSAFHALGNAVNAKIVKKVALSVFSPH